MRSGKFDSASSKLPGRLSSQGGGGGATWSPMGARNRLDGRARPPPEPRSRDTQNQTASHLASATSQIRPRNIHPTAFVLYAVKSFRHSGSRRTFVCMSVRLVCRGRGNTAHSSHLISQGPFSDRQVFTVACCGGAASELARAKHQWLRPQRHRQWHRRPPPRRRNCAARGTRREDRARLRSRTGSN